MTILVKLIAKYSNWLYVAGVLGILFYLRIAFLAKQERARSVFSLEREAATSKAYQALVAAFAFAAGMGLVFLITAVIAPRLALPPEEEETPFAFIIPTSTPTLPPPTETPTPTPTRLRSTVEPRPTPTDTPVPTNTPLPTPHCPNPKARLTTPAMNAVLRGAVQISGSANIDNFQYYKIEVGVGENPTSWSLITDLRYNPVAGGLLDVWDTTAFPAGVYQVRLVVVDATGNFPEPCEVRVIVEH